MSTIAGAGPSAPEPGPDAGSTSPASFFDRQIPAGYDREWAERLASQGPDAEASQDEIGAVIFRIGGEWLALPTRACAEIAPIPPLHSVPMRTNAVFRGLANVRGEVQLCVSLHGLFGIAEPDPPGPPSGRLLIIEDRGATWAFPADEIAGVHRIPASAMREGPATLGSGIIRGRRIFSWEGKTAGLLDDERLFEALRGLGR
jgi:chemotaxis-related protein WspD